VRPEMAAAPQARSARFETRDASTRRLGTFADNGRFCGLNIVVMLQYIIACSAHGVTSTAFRNYSRGEEHDTSHVSTSQLEEVPRSMHRDNFTVKLGCYCSRRFLASHC